MTDTTNAAAPPAWAVAMKGGPPPDAATPAWAVALTDEFACEALANIAEMLRRVRASRDRMTEVLPLPPAEVGPVLASLRVPRTAAQEALNKGLMQIQAT